MLLNIAETPVSVAGIEPRSNRFKIVAKCGGLYGDWRARNEDAYWKTIFRLSAVSFGYCRAGIVVFCIASSHVNTRHDVRTRCVVRRLMELGCIFAWVYQDKVISKETTTTCAL